MIWKTDWTQNDNYAENGAEQFDRLLANYNNLKDWFQEAFQVNITYHEISTDGFMTYPFDDMLNHLEENIRALKLWPLSDWIEKEAVWIPAGRAPDDTDVNRWEKNGQTLEMTGLSMEDDALFCGMFRCEDSHDQQKYTGGARD